MLIDFALLMIPKISEYVSLETDFRVILIFSDINSLVFNCLLEFLYNFKLFEASCMSFYA